MSSDSGKTAKNSSSEKSTGGTSKETVIADTTESMENKSMENKSEQVTVLIAHPIRPGVVGNEAELQPGTDFTTSKARAKTLVTQGAAQYKD